MTTRLTVSVEIAAPVDVTWQIVTDWERQGEWMPLTSVQVVTDGSVGVGTRMLGLESVGRVSSIR
jgi:uncharacterized protein YndB with AHSA1/START domain